MLGNKITNIFVLIKHLLQNSWKFACCCVEPWGCFVLSLSITAQIWLLGHHFTLIKKLPNSNNFSFVTRGGHGFEEKDLLHLSQFLCLLPGSFSLSHVDFVSPHPNIELSNYPLMPNGWVLRCPKSFVPTATQLSRVGKYSLEKPLHL